MTQARKTPYISEDERRKTLRFDSRYLQSAMYTHAPFELALSYSRAIMGFLLFQPSPRHILIVGLGGGSLSKYCYRYLPEASVTTVEVDENVLALRDQFAIPPDEERFRIVHADGAEFIEQSPGEQFDAIVLDAYGPDGLPEPLSSQDFYDRCAAAASPGGVVVANFVDNDWRRSLYVSRIRTAFDDKVISIQADRGSNQIVFALRRDYLPSWRTLYTCAVELEMRHKIRFRTIAAQMRSCVDADACGL